MSNGRQHLVSRSVEDRAPSRQALERIELAGDLDLNLDDLWDDLPTRDIVRQGPINKEDFFIEDDEEEPQTVSILEEILLRLEAVS